MSSSTCYISEVLFYLIVSNREGLVAVWTRLDYVQTLSNVLDQLRIRRPPCTAFFVVRALDRELSYLLADKLVRKELENKYHIINVHVHFDRCFLPASRHQLLVLRHSQDEDILGTN